MALLHTGNLLDGYVNLTDLEASLATEDEKQTLREMERNPERFDSERLKEEIAHAKRTSMTGERRFFCAVAERNGYHGLCAPLIVYAILFGWEKELGDMLDEGFALQGSMSLLAADRTNDGPFAAHHDSFENTARINVVGLLMNSRLPEPLLEKCLVRLFECRENARAVITMDRVFYNPRHGMYMERVELEKSYLPDMKWDVLKKNLHFAFEKFPDLFLGKWKAMPALYPVVPTMLLLESMTWFLGFYEGRADLREAVFWLGKLLVRVQDKSVAFLRARAKDCYTERSLDYMMNLRKKKTLEHLLQKIKQLDALAVTKEEKRAYHEFLVRFLFSLTGDEVYLGEEGKQNLGRVLTEAKAYCDEAMYYPCCVEMLANPDRAQDLDGDILEIYHWLSGEKITLRMEGKAEREFVKKRLFSVPADEDQEFVELELADYCVRELLEKIQKFEYADEKVMCKDMNGYLDNLVEQERTDLLRACVQKGLFYQGYIENRLPKFIKSKSEKQRQIVPLLLLHRYGVV